MVLIPLLIVLGLASAWYWLQPSTQPGLDAGRRVAEEFLELIQSGRPEAAWESTTAEFKSAIGREAFVRQAKAAKALHKPSQFITAETVQVQQEPRTEYLFREPESGETVRLVIGMDAGAWRVDRWLLQ